MVEAMSSGLVSYDQSPGSPNEAPLEGDGIQDPNMEEGTPGDPSLESPLSPDAQTTPGPQETTPDCGKMEAEHSDGPHPISLEMIGSGGLTLEAKLEMEELRIRTGNDPDAAEFELLVLPGQLKLSADLRHLKRNVVFVHSLSMAEFTHPNVLEIMANCQDFRVAFNRQPEMTSEQSFWKGCMTFRMATLSDTEEAFLLLKDIRPNIHARVLKDSETAFDAMERWCNLSLNFDETKEIDRLLIANNLAPGSTEAKLKHIFSDAVEVVLAQRKICDKSFAYLIFESPSKTVEAYRKYTSRNINYDGHILRILKYEPPKNIPEDFLRLRERFQILRLLERFVATLDSVVSLPAQLQSKLTKAASYLSGLLNSDERSRRILNLPIFSLEELHLVLDISRSLPVVDQPPFTELFAAFNVELDRLKESQNDRKQYLCRSVHNDSSEIDAKTERSEMDFERRKRGPTSPGSADDLPARRSEDSDHRPRRPLRHLLPRPPSSSLAPLHHGRTFNAARQFPTSSANMRRTPYPRDFSYSRGYGRIRHEPFASSHNPSHRRPRQFWTKR